MPPILIAHEMGEASWRVVACHWKMEICFRGRHYCRGGDTFALDLESDETHWFKVTPEFFNKTDKNNKS